MLTLLLAAITTQAPTHVRVDFDFALMRPTGRTPNTMAKTWFFEVPRARSDEKSMNELLNRIFFDANVWLRTREPTDTAYLTLVKLTTVQIDKKTLLEWDGKSTEAFPWHAAQKKIVWEPGACFFVDARGRYDRLDAVDFTELLMDRLVEEKKVDEAKWIAFFDRYFPDKPQGKTLWAERSKRMKNLVTIRDSDRYRKAPGTAPIASGPVDEVFKGLSKKAP